MAALFRLRIEDTDRARSTPEAVAAIIDGLQWLGLGWDGDVVYQSQRAERHAEVARQLLAHGPRLSLLVHARRTRSDAREGARREAFGAL